MDVGMMMICAAYGWENIDDDQARDEDVDTKPLPGTTWSGKYADPGDPVMSPRIQSWTAEATVSAAAE
jgi:hypothetical protein